MKLIYSALREVTQQFIQNVITTKNDNEQLRLAAYQTVCKKYADEIKAVKQWLPDWEPAFMLKG